MSIKITGADELKRKLEALKNLDGNRIAQAIADRGKDIAESNIASSGSISVESNIIGDGKARITASGAQIAFLEYGIGTRGDGTYPGKTPKQSLTFIARNNKPITLDEWTYNYFVEKVDRKAKPVDGFQALAPMWRTANSLEQGEALQAVKDLIQSEGK